MRAMCVLLSAILAIVFFVAPAVQGRDLPEPSFANRKKVPPLPQGLTWLNTSGPIELSDLRGKLVLCDFWTYCCINCMHILPELNKLEHAYPKELVVIGVHSAKFSTERDSENIKQAISRYKIEHPVVNDAKHVLWDFFGVDVWPTLVLIDPEGYVIWTQSGEVTFEQLDRVIKAAVAHYKKRKLIDETPLKFNATLKTDEPTPLRYPGKIITDPAGDRLFISDSNHNRIVITRRDGQLIATVGSGQAGLKDGDYETSQFKQPEGMALDHEKLFVADTENHAIRRIDLTLHTVTTVAGTGKQLRTPPSPTRHAEGKHAVLSSPWDLTIENRQLYVAMAGCHQIWRMRADGGAIGPFAGNGREDIVDGPLLPAQAYEAGFASFAQPSGLASDGADLFVADSEGSSIRAVPIKRHDNVRTIVGTAALAEARLFTFGDIDGPAAKVRLQHPLGLAYANGTLYVADTYNHKIKAINVASGATRTIAGTGRPGKAVSPPTFREPAGLAIAGGTLFIADTNNHRVCTLNLASGEVAELPIKGLKPPKEITAPIEPDGELIKLPVTNVQASDHHVRLQVRLTLPAGFHLNTDAPLAYQVDATTASELIDSKELGKRVIVEKPADTFDILLPVQQASGEITLRVGLTYYFCRSGNDGICRANSVAWSVPIKVDPSSTTDVVSLDYLSP